MYTLANIRRIFHFSKSSATNAVSFGSNYSKTAVDVNGLSEVNP